MYREGTLRNKLYRAEFSGSIIKSLASANQRNADSDILGLKGAIMRRIALVLTLAAVTLLLAQSPPPWSWDYIVPDPPNHSLPIHSCVPGAPARCCRSWQRSGRPANRPGTGRVGEQIEKKR